VCDRDNLKPFFDLGAQPLANSLLKSPNEHEEFYPLALSWCSDCNLVQLEETVDPKVLFTNYVWVTGTSKVANQYAEKFCDRLIARTSINKEKDYVLEVASNDGTFLLPFIKQGYKVLGVDPAENIAEIAEKSGVPTLCAFWSDAAAKDLVRERGSAKTIFARNVLPHVANTRDFVAGLASALDKDGVLAIEAHYAKIILDELHYDSIYHEHLCYFTLKNLERLLNDFGLFVFDIEKSPISGGSIVVYARKTKSDGSQELLKYRAQEKSLKINELSNWEEFAKHAHAHKDKLLKILSDSKTDGKKIVGWGASARSSTLLNFCGINSIIISIIADQAPLKQGLYTAGTHILIEKPEVVMNQNPDVVFILGWNFAEEIMERLRQDFKYRGEYLIPLPNEPRVIASK